jgi:hypothetical protein
MSKAPTTPWSSSLEERPDYVHAIGMISIENGNLELSLADLFARTLSISKKMAHAIYFTPRAAALRVEILQAAARTRLAPRPKISPTHPLEVQKSDALRKVERLVKRSFGVMQRRHEVMHDAWGIARDEKDEPVIRGSGRDLIQSEARDAPLRELTDLIRDLRDVITDVDRLVAEFTNRPPAMADLRRSLTKSGSSARTDNAGKPASRKN